MSDHIYEKKNDRLYFAWDTLNFCSLGWLRLWFPVFVLTCFHTFHYFDHPPIHLYYIDEKFWYKLSIGFCRQSHPCATGKAIAFPRNPRSYTSVSVRYIWDVIFELCNFSIWVPVISMLFGAQGEWCALGGALFWLAPRVVMVSHWLTYASTVWYLCLLGFPKPVPAGELIVCQVSFISCVYQHQR